MEQLLAFLDRIYPLSAPLKKHLTSILKCQDFAARDFLLKKGKPAYFVYFLQKGLVRSFYEKSNKEVSSGFWREGDVVISVESFYTQTASRENIQALEDCTAYYITFDELRYIYQHFSEFNYVGRELTEHYYLKSERQLYSLQRQTAAQRYQHFLEHYPDLQRRLPNKYIASYLGITLETLSRIKGKVLSDSSW